MGFHMSYGEIIEIATTILASLGTGALIVLGCSSWLGKIWAERIMEKERASYAMELEKLRSSLNKEVATDLELWKKQLDVTATRSLREISDKLTIYQSTVDLISEVLGDFDRVSRDPVATQNGPDRIDDFNRKRMKAYGRIAMLAPQTVVDTFDGLTDHLFAVASGQKQYVWEEIRQLAIALINEVRIDIGLDKSPIVYREIMR
jgi:uncharacterized membrane protein